MEGVGAGHKRRTEEPLSRNYFAVPAAGELYGPIDRPNEKEDGHG